MLALVKANDYRLGSQGHAAALLLKVDGKETRRTSGTNMWLSQQSQTKNDQEQITPACFLNFWPVSMLLGVHLSFKPVHRF